MRKTLSILAIALVLIVVPAMATTLDTATNENCLGTDCSTMTGAAGTVQIDSCRDKLYMDVDLSGLEPGNYQLSIQTYPGDKRLDSTDVCLNPNAPRGGAYANAWECGSWTDYSFYNFDMDVVPTNGNFHNTYTIPLPDGYYDTILLVKHDNSDATGGVSYPIVLQKSHVSFSVSQFCNANSDARINALEARIVTLEGQTCSCVDGAKGDKGDQGIQGIPGIQGERGIDGLNGTNGLAGLNGQDGAKGDKGDNGAACETTSCISTANAYTDTQVSPINAVIDGSRTYFPEFWNWYGSDRECTKKQTKCVGSDKMKCGSDYKWTKESTCQYGCTAGVCNPQPKDNCLTKATEYYCSDSTHAVAKDYTSCRFWFGSDAQCDIGKCGYNTISTTCKKGCNTTSGKCK